jgi:hypothetical protein
MGTGRQLLPLFCNSPCLFRDLRENYLLSFMSLIGTSVEGVFLKTYKFFIPQKKTLLKTCYWNKNRK